MQKFKNILFVIISTLVLANCGGGGGGGSEPAPVPTPPPAPTASISANPTTLWVNESVTLTWSSTNATGCSAGGEWSGDKDPSGEESVTVTKDGELTYSITCSSGTRSATSEVAITANPINQTGVYRQEDGTDIFLDAGTQNIFQMPLVEQYLTEKYEGYTYGTGVVFPPNYWGNGLISCETSDLNSDNNPDIVAITNIMYSGGENAENDNKYPEIIPRIHFLLNNGDGTFSDDHNLIPGTDYHRVSGYKEANKGDLNNDGLDDFLLESIGSSGLVRGNGMLVLMSQADGTWQDETDKIQFSRRENIQRRDYVQENVLGANGGPLLMFDLNGDGYKDLFNLMSTQNQGGLATVYLSDEANSFKPWDRWNEDENRYRNELFNGSIRAGEVVDFDNDGDEDLVLQCYFGYCFGNPDEQYYKDREQFYPWGPFEVDSHNGFVILNEDGVLDMANAIHFPSTAYDNNTKGDDIDVGDVNGDGFPDVVVAYGKAVPYYINRKIQLLINDGGTALVDETEERMPEDQRDDASGHAEGMIRLVDVDGDGDLDIYDYQANVREGEYYDNVCDCKVEYPYGRNGEAIFINDGQGNFEYQELDIFNVDELKDYDNGTGNGWVGNGLDEGLGGFKCPVDFGDGYGTGWIFQFGYDNDVRNAGNAGIEGEHSNWSFGVVRKISDQDNFKEEQ